MKAKVWIARDSNGALHLYNKRPVVSFSFKYYCPQDFSDIMRLDREAHPEITFKNSPQLIEV